MSIAVADWAARAACVGMDSEVFFPETPTGVRAAKQVCAGCEVRQQCLIHALAHTERHGVWGGTSERERRRIRLRIRV